MRALTWQAPTRVSIEEVPDPRIEEPTDAVIRVTSTAICGSDLHLYDVLAPYLSPGDVLGHEVMGIIEEVGSAVTRFAPGDRVVVPFVISCGVCSACRVGLTTQCESTQVREHESGGALYGYTELYGSIPGGQAERMRVLRADANLLRVEPGLPDDRYLFLSDILPTAWQGVAYAGVPAGESIAILGPRSGGPTRGANSRRASHATATSRCSRSIPCPSGENSRNASESAPTTSTRPSRGCGMRPAVGAPPPWSTPSEWRPTATPSRRPRKPRRRGCPDGWGGGCCSRWGSTGSPPYTSPSTSCAGGTVSLSGVYGGVADPLPMLRMFDKQLTLRMGQCNVQSWLVTLLPLVEDPADPLGVTRLTTHRCRWSRPRDVRDVQEEGRRVRQGRSRAVITRWLVAHGLLLTTLLLFVVFVVGMAAAGWDVARSDALEHGDAPPALAAYLSSGDFAEALFENWESEFLQMGAYVVLTVFLFQRGSSESKPWGEPAPQDEDPRTHAPRRPRRALARAARRLGARGVRELALPALRRALRRRVRAPPPGRRRRLQRRSGGSHGLPAVTPAEYLATTQFWFESLQNWQSEFLVVAVLVGASVVLRQRGSPESKPVHVPHRRTG